MAKNGPTSPGSYTPPSFRGALLMLLVSVLVVAGAWWVYATAGS